MAVGCHPEQEHGKCHPELVEGLSKGDSLSFIYTIETNFYLYPNRKSLNLQTLKKILIVVESIDVEDSSGSKANVALIQNLNKAGFEVLVYHYTRKEVKLPGIVCVSIKENRRSPLFFLSRLERNSRDHLKLDMHKPLQNIFGFSFTLFNDRNSIVAALRKIEGFNPDLVLTLSKGGSFRPHHALLKMPELHKKWIAYMHDPYPMHHYPKPFTYTEPGSVKKENFIREISKKATFSAFPSKLLQEWMGNFYPDFLRSGFVIPHQIIEISTEGIEFPIYFDPKSFNLLHAGNLLGARNPKGLAKAFSNFLIKFPEAKHHSKLIFLGGNNKRLLNMETKNIENIYVSEEYVSFEQVFKMQQHAAVNIILEAKAEISPFLPGKFPHCVQADKPILLLGPPKGEARRLLGENYKFWAEIDDLDGITKSIENLYLQWCKSPQDFRLNRPELSKYLTVSNLKTIIEKILSN